MLLAYLGPDTVMPLTSTLAAALGVLLVFGRQAARVVTATARRFTPRGRAPAARPRRQGVTR